MLFVRTLRNRASVRVLFPALALLVWAAPVSAADPNGAELYRKHCARCHGANGEGAKNYPHPLIGDLNVTSLAKLIDKTMPEEEPGKLGPAGAASVAAYCYRAFYSPEAQARINPAGKSTARVELARLTQHQYRNAVADLIGSFRASPKPDDRHGLRGEYFNARNFQTATRLIDRIDPEVRFDFGTTGPAEKFDPRQFSIRWEGSVLPPETGMYDFVIRTEHAARLWVNDPRTPLIDAWVKSGTDTEFRASVFLLAGRSYSLKLEFSKAKQGVDDSKKKPAPPPKPASMTLLWKPPHRATEVIPVRALSPARAPQVFVVETRFPPDDRSLGWERGTTVSKEWDAATTDAALETAGYIAGRLNEFVGPDRGAKLKDFCRTFAERAFRRPLTEEQKRAIVDRAFANTSDPELALKRVVVFVLKSPRFLYREVGGPANAYTVASRLSFTLWDSAPDDELRKAAVAGKLATPEQVAAQAERMLTDPRAKAKLRAFLFTWLKLDLPPDMAKDAKRFPGFDDAAIADLRTSMELFLDDVVWSGNADFRQLFLADSVYLNGRLAKLYGADLPADAGFRKVKLDNGSRTGVLTHPYLLAAFAYTAESSPIHRGVFLAKNILGVALHPPPDAFTPLPVDLHPTLTTRERVALQTKPATCTACHRTIDRLGFTLEHYDAIGRYRDQDRGKPVDASGQYRTRIGDDHKFAGSPDLAKFLAASPDAQTAFVERLFHHLVKQPVRAYGSNRPEELRAEFEKSGFNIRRLAVTIAVSAALPPTPQTTDR